MQNKLSAMWQSKVKFLGSKRNLSLALLLILGALAPSAASAQGIRSKADRNNGGGFFETQRSSRGISHARDYARDIYQYSSPRPVYQYSQAIPVTQYSTAPAVVSAPVMKSESQRLQQTIVVAKQDVAVLQEQFKSNPTKLESVKTIDQHLTKAAELQKDLHIECCKDTVDGMVCAMCASKIVKELDKAAAEHESLVRDGNRSKSRGQ